MTKKTPGVWIWMYRFAIKIELNTYCLYDNSTESYFGRPSTKLHSCAIKLKCELMTNFLRILCQYKFTCVFFTLMFV